MQIAHPTPAEHAEFRAIVNAEIRPDRAETNAWDDFPLVLDPANAGWTLVARGEDGRVAAGLAALIRCLITSIGKVRVAGLGSVVTRADCRGQGLSRSLQNAMLAELARNEVPLAVLWTDQPEIYAGRGFVAAGWERHVALAGADLPGEESCRPYRDDDARAVASLYAGHPWRTLREPGDADRLYGMPGTRGLVAVDPHDAPTAAVFCGKGADFPGYVAEWSGPVARVLGLLGAARDRGWAEHLLAPAGSEELVNGLVERGAGWFAAPSGQWRVGDAAALGDLARIAGLQPPAGDDPRQWLGSVDDRGQPHRGVIDLAVWGFDSV